MANTFSQVNIHVVFTVKGRGNALKKEFRDRLFEYITGTMKSIGLFPLAVNGFADHVHIFFELPTTITIAKAIQEIKSNSSKWINDQHLVPGKFQWQAGFGVFSNSRSQRNSVIQYIINQESHHTKTTFREEYFEFLKKYGIDFNEKYLFEFYED
jgi:REP element-mobilizing transposase RayT